MLIRSIQLSQARVTAGVNTVLVICKGFDVGQIKKQQQQQQQTPSDE